MYRVLNFLLILQYLLHETSQSSIIILDHQSAGGCQPCYRKLFTGKRLAEIHIRKAIDCERIEECSRECDAEKGFPCEGFNYRYQGSRNEPPRGRSHGICELTSMPPSQIDIHRDILHEPRYDYYERDQGCYSKRPSRPSSLNSQTGWHDLRPPHHEQEEEEEQPYLQRPIEIPRPLLPDRIRPIEIPRPLGYDYLPNRRFHGEKTHWRPEDTYQRRIPPINIRPIEDNVRYEYFMPSVRPYLPKDVRPNNQRGENWYRPENHDSGINEIEAYKPGRRKDSVQYGSGIYGGSYGYNTNNIEGYELPKRVKNPTNHYKRPYDNTDVYNYGGAFGYGDDNYSPVDRDVGYEVSGRYEECSKRAGAGFKLRRGIVRKSYLTPTLDQCENLCVVEKDCLCMTFSYRYSLATNAPTDNCLLSEISYRDLDFYTDIEPDRDYDIYSITGNPKTCGKGRPTNQRPPEDCFWRVRSGCGVPPEVVRKSIIARGLGDCEAECVESRLFTCRSFVYRYGEVSASINGAPNCYLSDWPSQEIDPLSLPEVNGAELYQRGSFGRGCEPSPFPPLNHHRRRPEPDNRPAKRDEVCYAEYKKPCRLSPEAVMLTIYVDSEYECRERCSNMRERDPVPCMSFSYRISSDREDHNCFMSDVPRRDLRPGIDYIHGDGYLLFAWKEFDPQCDSGYSIGIFIDDEDRDFNPNRPQSHGYSSRPSSPSFGQNPGPYPTQFERPYENEQRPQRPNGNRYPPPSDFDDHRPPGRPVGHGGYGSNYRPNNDGGNYHYGRPLNPDRPDPIPPNYGGPVGDKRPIQSGGFYGGGGGGRGSGWSYHDTDGRFNHGYSDDRYNDISYNYRESTFSHFTVNGRACKRGTRCERNKVAGFWSCEPEGSEYGTWDYCCEPKHHCGYSQGYNYPWCYVGPYEDQWRPCSEKYYPYLPGHRPVRPSSDRYDEENPYGEIPRPLLGRHWPVAYLHREAPPNATDSVATADRRMNREFRNLTINTSARTHAVKTRGNYVVKDSETIEDRLDPDFRLESESGSSGHVRSGKIERITRFSEFRGTRRSQSRNSTDSRRNDHAEDRKEIDETFELRDLTNRQGAATTRVVNKTDELSSSWQGTTFVRLPTISANKSKESSFEDYFEVVNVD